MKKDLVKVHFKLVQNEENYPPYDSEAMWCEKIDDHRLRLDNIPFFVTGVSLSDIISADERSKGFFSFNQVIEESGHSTIRVMFLDTANDGRPVEVRAEELGNRLCELGCAVRPSPPPSLLAVDVPPATAIVSVRNILAQGEAAGLWSYEEGTLAHSS